MPIGKLLSIVGQMENYSKAFDMTFHALSDPTRRAVIASLMRGSASVKELAEPFPMGLPSFMKHIKVLEDSGLIVSEKVGRVRTCHIKSEQLKAVESWLHEQQKIWNDRTNRLADYVENLSSKGK